LAWGVGPRSYIVTIRRINVAHQRKADTAREPREPIDVILNDDIVPIGQRDKTIPKNLCAVLGKALEKKANDRYQTAAEMLVAMKKALP
jgi:hypothetical protein